MHFAESLRHCLDTDARDEIRLLLGGIHDLPVLLVMPPHPQRESGCEQQEHAEAKQTAAGPAPPCGPPRRRFRDIAIRCRKERLRGRLL
jgi:hypothetical protein